MEQLLKELLKRNSGEVTGSIQTKISEGIPRDIFDESERKTQKSM